jgi:DNA-directed RNA polymerase subunit RPC12/RpoP
MPNDEPNPNGETPKQELPEELQFDRGPVICQRCKRRFEHFVLEEIDDLVQLRCGDVLVSKTEMVCLHCGAIFYWNIRERDLEKMAVKYGELSSKLQGYNSE